MFFGTVDNYIVYCTPIYAIILMYFFFEIWLYYVYMFTRYYIFVQVLFLLNLLKIYSHFDMMQAFLKRIKCTLFFIINKSVWAVICTAFVSFYVQ